MFTYAYIIECVVHKHKLPVNAYEFVLNLYRYMVYIEARAITQPNARYPKPTPMKRPRPHDSFHITNISITCSRQHNTSNRATTSASSSLPRAMHMYTNI